MGQCSHPLFRKKPASAVKEIKAMEKVRIISCCASSPWVVPLHMVKESVLMSDPPPVQRLKVT